MLKLRGVIFDVYDDDVQKYEKHRDQVNLPNLEVGILFVSLFREMAPPRKKKTLQDT